MYPKRLYAATGGSVTVHDVHHEKSLGPGWSDNPPAPPQPEVKPPMPAAEPKGKKSSAAGGKTAATPEPEVKDPASTEPGA